jgi:hypothetical protein
MRVEFHPPLFITGADWHGRTDDCECLIHASLWLDVSVEPWGVHRRGHLHFVTGDAESEWRVVDLARLPLQRWTGEDPSDRSAVEARLADLVNRLDLGLYRIPGLGMVSELGEGRDEFRRRALAILRPKIQHAADSRDDGEAGSMVGAVARIAGSIETWSVPDAAEAVKRAEVGTLWLARGVALEARRDRPLML